MPLADTSEDDAIVESLPIGASLEKGVFPIGYTRRENIIFVDIKPRKDEVERGLSHRPIRIMISGATDAGKSIVARSCSDALAYNNIPMFCMNDVKGEMASSVYSNHLFKHMLMKGMQIDLNYSESVASEKAEALAPMFPVSGQGEIAVYSPEWAHVPGTLPYSIRLGDLEEEAVCTLLDRMGKNQKWVVEDLLDFIQSHFRGEFNGIMTKGFRSELAKYISEHTLFQEDKLNQSTAVLTILSDIRRLIVKRKINGEHPVSVEEMVLNSDGRPRSVVLDWHGLPVKKRDKSKNLYDVYTAYYLDQLMDARVRCVHGEGGAYVPEFLVVLDECQKLLEKDVVRETKRSASVCMREMRAYGISMVLASQTIMIEKEFIQNSDLLVISPSHEAGELSYVRRSVPSAFVRSTDDVFFQTLRPWEKLLVDVKGRTNLHRFTRDKYVIFTPFPSLSLHATGVKREEVS